LFTGIIEELGKIASFDITSGGAKIVVAASLVTAGSVDGDSIAVNGVCLTALNVTPDSFAADVSQETLDRSTLGSLTTGSPVNLERAVTPATRLGGHIVQGHVDVRGTFNSAIQTGDFWAVRIGFPAGISQYFVHKGSVSVEGISLTIADLGDDYFEIAVIPKTWELTNLSSLNPGDAVNLEADVIAKYVERMLFRDQPPEEQTTTVETLKKAGFLRDDLPNASY
jgi:riboflavin synthase